MTVDELKALRVAETDAELGRLEGVTRQRVSQWRKRGYVPARYDETTNTETKTDEQANAK